MSRECTRCGGAIAEDAPRYTRRTSQGETNHFCSLNCIADTDEFDESTVRATLFDAVAAE